jgi:hypothetical protein
MLVGSTYLVGVKKYDLFQLESTGAGASPIMRPVLAVCGELPIVATAAQRESSSSKHTIILIQAASSGKQ